MNNRERLLAILNHEPPDRIPWIPRLLLWYQARKLSGTMPPALQGLSLREVEHELGVGTPARDGRVFEMQREGVDVVERREGNRRITEYHTPAGSVRTVMRYSEELDQAGLPGRVEEFLLKGPADYRVWEWIVEHTEWIPAYEAYREYDAEIGDDGLPMVSAGDVPLHEFAQALAGYENAFYQLHDYQEEVEHLLGVMLEVQRAKQWPIIFDSPARLLLHGVHLSSQFTPPRLFERYVLPYYHAFMPLAHDAGMSVAMHADNDTSQILHHIERAGWDMVECFVTAPMVPLTIRQAREAWGERVIIWGGIPSNMLSPSVTDDDFQDYMRMLFATIAPGDAFILGVADNVMPDSIIERVAWVSDFVEEQGYYPIVMPRDRELSPTKD
jgi:hypothetical protein